MPHKDPEARRAYHREYERKNRDKVREWRHTSYERNKESVLRRTTAHHLIPEVKATRKEQALERVRIKQAWANSYKAEHGCSICGERHPACLDFHHEDPLGKSQHGKPSTISTGVRKWSMGRLMAEVEKCAVVCANCHRKIHADMGWEWTHTVRGGVQVEAIQ